MPTLRKFFVRIVGFFRRRTLEAEMNAELQAHLDGLTERNIAAGMSPEEARYAAMRAFGGVEQVRESARDQRRSGWCEGVLQDLRYAGRQLRKTPGSAAVIVISLALGIGANTAIFSLVDEVVLKPLPIRDPHELVVFEWRVGVHAPVGGGYERRDPMTGERIGTGFTRAAFEDFLGDRSAPVDLFAFFAGSSEVSVDGRPETNTTTQLVSGDYFGVLHAEPALGRLLFADDDLPGAASVAVISHRYWWRRFGGDPSVIGKNIGVNKVPTTIVGVAQPSFHGPLQRGAANDIFVPFALAPAVVASAFDVWWGRVVMGRLRPGGTIQDLQTRFAPSFRTAALEAIRGHPREAFWLKSRGFPRLQVRDGRQGVLLPDQRWLATLQGLAAVLLVIACANVANLLLARGAARHREIAVRLALGASRPRLVRQLFTESSLLALLGATLGTLLAWWGKDLLLALHPLGSVSLFNPLLDTRVLGFTIGAAIATSVLFGLVPAWRTTRLDLMVEFQGGRNIGGGPRETLRLSRLLMMSQVALSSVLLVVAGLFSRTLGNLRSADVGFNREHLLLFRLEPMANGYARELLPALIDRVVAQLGSKPGVRSVTYSDFAVLSGGNAYLDRISVPNYQAPRGEDPDAAAVMRFTVGPGFFETYDIPILRGRAFSPRDDRTAPRVAVIDQTMARKYFGEEDPIGRAFRFGERSDEPPTEIVGVVPGTKTINLRHPGYPTFYLPLLQRDLVLSRPHFAIRTVADPATMMPVVRGVLEQINPTLPAVNLRTQDEQAEKLVLQEKFFARLAGFFSLMALLLVSIGLYGLMSYTVFRRTGEIGIRMALGALPQGVLWMILADSLKLVVAGLVAGIAGAWAASRLVASMLYGLSATDPITYGFVSGLMLVVALFACFLPARRAATVDPMVALRAE